MRLSQDQICWVLNSGGNTKRVSRRWIGSVYELPDTGYLLVLLISFWESVLSPCQGGTSWIMITKFSWLFRFWLLFLYLLVLLLAILLLVGVWNPLNLCCFCKLYRWFWEISMYIWLLKRLIRLDLICWQLSFLWCFHFLMFYYCV